MSNQQLVCVHGYSEGCMYCPPRVEQRPSKTHTYVPVPAADLAAYRKAVFERVVKPYLARYGERCRLQDAARRRYVR